MLHWTTAAARAVVAVACVVLAAATGFAQSNTTFKVAYYNIQSGKGEPALPGRTSTFVDTANCTDSSKPLNAWGKGIVQRELRARVGADSAIIALGLGEAWLCASPWNVAAALGWPAVSTERNGVAIVARFGFDGPEEWQQLDTSLNENPGDTMWVLRVKACVDIQCTASVWVAVVHWWATIGSPSAPTTLDRQAEQSVAFLAALKEQPHVFIGDLNAWESTATSICGQVPIAAGLNRLRAAGYTDAWRYLHGTADGFTGMTNRQNCGTPEGAAWKRIDYSWSKGLVPVTMTRFGVVPGGEEAPSDHYGIIAEYSRTAEPPQVIVGRLGPGDALMYAADATFAGDWRRIADATAATGFAADNPDRGTPKRLTALASPADFIEATFMADRGRPYRLWLRGKAALNGWTNDSVFVQFSGSVSLEGAPVWRIGSTDATVVSIEDCSGCGLAGWGWADNGYGKAGPLVYFAQSGTQKVRIQPREDGVRIDQILLSPDWYLTRAPGDVRNDTTIYKSGTTADIVRYAADATISGAGWVRLNDPLAALGTAVRNPDRGTPKQLAAVASPASYVEVTFNAEAGRPYRLWLRGRAEGNAWSNDSVYVQFSGSVTETRIPVWRIGSTSATWVSIEDCSGCGLSGWGWQDNGYGLGALGPLVYFESTGLQTLRIQQREDGIIVDQIVLSPERYLTSPPGVTKNDTTIVPR